MSTQEDLENKLEILRVRGLPISPRCMFDGAIIEEAMDFQHKPGDIILCAYPKTGSTWMMYVIKYILEKSVEFYEVKEMYFEKVPYPERIGTAILNTMKEPRFFKYHIPYTYMTPNKKAKYVYMYRNPEDIIASYYPFNLQYGKEKYDFDFFFDAFLEGNVGFGSYFDHVRSFYDRKDDGNILLISYEDTKLDTRKQILKIAKFLSEDCYQALVKNEDLLQQILDKTSYDYMKKNLSFAVPDITGGEDKTYEFFRKGVVGDGKSRLNEEQLKRLKKKMLEKMSGTEFVDIWLKDV